MSTPQRSRYPRPLKATHTFAGGSSGPSGQAQSGPVGQTTQPSGTTGSSSASTPTNAAATAATGPAIAAPAGPFKNGQNSPPPPSGGSSMRRCMSSPERRSPVSYHRGDGVGENGGGPGLNPRRSNSLGSLSDPDCYMNSLWPRANASANQGESEEPLTGGDVEFDLFSHKRSNSCSGDDRLKVNKPVSLKNGVVSSAHTRKSVEGLNQEVSAVLEGNPIRLVEATPPDGRMAPVQDLLGRASIGTQTPPFSQTPPSSLGPVAALPLSSTSPSPSTSASNHTTTNTTDSAHSGTNGSTRESPASFQHPPSPKPSFAREPPDGAERCTIKVETSVHMEGFIPTGPDKSKGTIIFKGTAFAPPLATPPQSLQSVP